MLRKYPQGSDLTIMNTMYIYPKRDDQTGKWDKGSMTIVYKDNLTGQKHTECIDNPDYEFYFLKEGLSLDYNELFIEKEKVDKVTVPYNDILKEIAERTDNMAYYRENIKLGNRGANKRLHTHPKVFLSDNNIEDHYRFRFDNLYQNKQISISKTYFDIEADTINMKGDFPEPGECPINAITIVDEKNNKVFTLLLRNENNPLIEQFERSLSPDLFIELKQFIQDKCGGWKQEIKYGLKDLQYEILFYDEEINLIMDTFKYFNATKPDFILAWNMGFDIPYIIARLENLGYNPADIMCHPDFEKKVCKYIIDERNRNEFAERGDEARISSYSIYMDQMIQFASRRKGQSAFQSFTLDYIGGVVARVKKLDYSHITTSIAELPYKDYKTFVFYNIMDTIVQKCVESKVADIDYIFSKCLMNNTRYSKGHRQTVYLVNRGIKEFYKDGFIMGNNCNRDNEKPTEKFPGAFVADPRKLNDYAKMKVAGKAVNLANNVDDFDYKSLYPSEMREFNMAPNTQIGKIIIDQKVRENENPFNNKYFTRAGYFIEDFHSGVFLEFAHRWLNLANYQELYNDVIDYFNNKANAYFINSFTKDGLIKVIQERNMEINNGRMPVFKKYREGELMKIMSYYTPTPMKEKIINDIPKQGVIYRGY